MINIIGHRKIYYIISGTLMMASAVALVLWGLKIGIDFTGGTIMELNYEGASRPSATTVQEQLKSLDLGEIIVQPAAESSMIVRLPAIDEETHQKTLAKLREGFGGQIVEQRFESIGPTIGQELKAKAFSAIILALIAISLYIAWAFRKASKPVSSWRYGITTLIALFHDILITVGVFAFLGYYLKVEVDSNFITALLVILGFSVHDTIVVFDRIRENLRRYSWTVFEDLVNRSVIETLRRSINTSLTVLLVLFCLYFFGGGTIKYFILALLIGITTGTYSSIFIASTLLVDWEKFKRRG